MPVRWQHPWQVWRSFSLGDQDCLAVFWLVTGRKTRWWLVLTTWLAIILAFFSSFFCFGLQTGSWQKRFNCEWLNVVRSLLFYHCTLWLLLLFFLVDFIFFSVAIEVLLVDFFSHLHPVILCPCQIFFRVYISEFLFVSVSICPRDYAIVLLCGWISFALDYHSIWVWACLHYGSLYPVLTT